MLLLFRIRKALESCANSALELSWLLSTSFVCSSSESEDEHPLLRGGQRMWTETFEELHRLCQMAATYQQKLFEMMQTPGSRYIEAFVRDLNDWIERTTLMLSWLASKLDGAVAGNAPPTAIYINDLVEEYKGLIEMAEQLTSPEDGEKKKPELNDTQVEDPGEPSNDDGPVVCEASPRKQFRVTSKRRVD